MQGQFPTPEPHAPTDAVRALMMAKIKQRMLRRHGGGFPGQAPEHNPHGLPPGLVGKFPPRPGLSPGFPTTQPIGEHPPVGAPVDPGNVPGGRLDPRAEIIRRLSPVDPGNVVGLPQPQPKGPTVGPGPGGNFIPMPVPKPSFNDQRGIGEVPVRSGSPFQPAQGRKLVLANVAQRLLAARQQLGGK